MNKQTEVMEVLNKKGWTYDDFEAIELHIDQLLINDRIARATQKMILRGKK
jgi:hypothetical protein